MAEKFTGSVKGVGARYGGKIRSKVARVQSNKRNSKTCPFCQYDKVVRKAVGIWDCKKCGKTFAAKAYSTR